MRRSREVHARDIAATKARIAWLEEGTEPSLDDALQTLAKNHDVMFEVLCWQVVQRAAGSTVPARAVELVEARQEENRRLTREANGG